MRRGAARGDQRGADAHVRNGGLLHAVQRHQQGFEGAVGQRLGHVVGFVFLKRRQAAALVNLLCFIAKQHRVAVEGNAHFGGVGIAGVGAVRVHLCRGHASGQRRAHIAQVGA